MNNGCGYQQDWQDRRSKKNFLRALLYFASVVLPLRDGVRAVIRGVTLGVDDRERQLLIDKYNEQVRLWNGRNGNNEYR